MKESTSGSMEAFDGGSEFTELEIELGKVLLRLRDGFYELDLLNLVSFNWAVTRRRSALSSTPSSPRLRSSPCLRQEVKETDERPQVKPSAASPSTPLSFSPSESDDKSKHSPKRNSKKRRREEWTGIVNGLSGGSELLTEEIETVKSYFYGLQNFNELLKAKNYETNCYHKKEKPHLEFDPRFNYGMKLERQHHHHYAAAASSSVFGHQRFLGHTAAYDQFAYLASSSSSSSSAAAMFNQGGPRGIPDLNICANETYGFDLRTAAVAVKARKRAEAAEARRRRKSKIDEKKSSTKKLQRNR